MSKHTHSCNIDNTLLSSHKIPILLNEKEYFVYTNSAVSFFLAVGDGLPLSTSYFQSKKGSLVLTNLRLIYISDFINIKEEEEKRIEKLKDCKLFETFCIPLNKIFSVDLNNLVVKLNNNMIANVSINVLNESTKPLKSLLTFHLQNLDEFFEEIANMEFEEVDYEKIYDEFF